MQKKKSPGFCGCCISSEDSRILVPHPWKIGWAVNFGNPRWLISFLALDALFAGAARCSLIAHPSYFAKSQPFILDYNGRRSCAIVHRLNSCFSWSDYRSVNLAAYGLVAAGIGFSAQR